MARLQALHNPALYKDGQLSKERLEEVLREAAKDLMGDEASMGGLSESCLS